MYREALCVIFKPPDSEHCDNSSFAFEDSTTDRFMGQSRRKDKWGARAGRRVVWKRQPNKLKGWNNLTYVNVHGASTYRSLQAHSVRCHLIVHWPTLRAQRCIYSCAAGFNDWLKMFIHSMRFPSLHVHTCTFEKSLLMFTFVLFPWTLDLGLNYPRNPRPCFTFFFSDQWDIWQK